MRATSRLRGTAIRFFRGLRDIRKDDEIELTTLNGSYVYRVELIQIVRVWVPCKFWIRPPNQF